LLILVAGSCAGWLVWTQWLEPAATPNPTPPSANTSLNKLQAIERIANRGRDAVPELVELLSDSDAATRRHALSGLGRIGPKAAEALEQIRERLTDENPHVREYAMTAFWQVGRNPDEAASVAAQLLADPDIGVREEAASFLETLGPRAIDAVSGMLRSDFAPARILALQLLRLWELDETKPEMNEAVRSLEDDPDPAVRSEALVTIVACGKPTASEIRLLLHREPSVTFKNASHAINQHGGNCVAIALAAIIRQGPVAAELLPGLLGLLGADGSSKSPQVPWLVLQALRALKGAAEPAVPRLRRLFEELQHSSDLNVRYSSIKIAETMFEVGAEGDELVPILIPLLKSDPWICWEVGKLLCRISPAAARKEALRLIDEMALGDAPVDPRDIRALEGLAPYASEAVPLLIPLIDNPDKVVSAIAIRTLGEIGPSAAAAVPMLAARLGRNLRNAPDSADSDIRVAEALRKIGPRAQSALPAILEMLDRAQAKRPDDPWYAGSYYKAAIGALRQIGDKSPPVLSALRLQLVNKSPEIRTAAIEALSHLGADSNDVLLILEQQLGDEDARVRIAAIDALASRADDSRAVLPSLLRQLDDPDAVVRSRAILAISRMNGDRSEAIPALTAALSDDNPYVRSAAAVTLGKIGPEAKSAVSTLQRMLREPGNWVRNSRHRPGRERLPEGLSYAPELADLSIREAARSALSQIDE
jgi:HEAT repeat protein